MTPTYTAIVPVKRWVDAKTRLGVPPAIRGDLARAFAVDVVEALTGSRCVGRVVVVSAEPGVEEIVRRHGAHRVVDPVSTGGHRLNASIGAGLAWAHREHPGDPVVVVPADLACLTSDALDAALVETDGGMAMLRDATGHGTTLLLGPSHAVVPAYGADSAARHAGLGHRELDDCDARLRRDVDSVDDLVEAVALGVGRASDAVVRRHLLDLAG